LETVVFIKKSTELYHAFPVASRNRVFCYNLLRYGYTMKKVTVTHWPDTAGQVTINKIRARLEQEGLKPYRFDMMPGDVYGDHAHPDAEIRWVVSGRMRVKVREGARPGAPGVGGCEREGARPGAPGVGGCEREGARPTGQEPVSAGEEIILDPGDRLDLAANVVHSADVFGDEAVVTLCASR
jgi:quercetin dioxygenase-like cupin family protein